MGRLLNGSSRGSARQRCGCGRCKQPLPPPNCTACEAPLLACRCFY